MRVRIEDVELDWREHRRVVFRRQGNLAQRLRTFGNAEPAGNNLFLPSWWDCYVRPRSVDRFVATADPRSARLVRLSWSPPLIAEV